LPGRMFFLEFAEPALAKKCAPGEFVMIQVESGTDPFLRRAFSVFFTNPKRGLLTILGKSYGFGTTLLREKKAGDRLRMVGPLGNRFGRAKKKEQTLLVAGGVGLAPLYFYQQDLAKSLRRDTQLFLGVRSKDEALALKKLMPSAMNLQFATDDGSYGYRGQVTDLLERWLEKNKNGKSVRVLSCGPDPMMAKTVEIAKKFELPIEVSLETAMACGYGICIGCAVKSIPDEKMESEFPKTSDGYIYQRACIDGPVFNGHQVAWEAD
ncbi:MAG TPA: dihydroorotate dehydrogenase electron transfer subunit, partial [candidate division Zixibacteria bacterium]|nr:dihydroorotate dehydrogenase electron transfer subunit [candidate division Zixibacteria bacterium]